MFIRIFLLTLLTALCHAQSLGNGKKHPYRTKPAYSKQWQLSNYNQMQGETKMNYMQTKAKQQPTGDAPVSATSGVNDMHRMRDGDQLELMRREDVGKIPEWSVPRAKHRLPVYTGTNVPTNTKVPTWSMEWSKYTDIPLNPRAGSTNADTEIKMPRMHWSHDTQTSLGNSARVPEDNPGLKQPVNSGRRSYNQDIPLFEKSEISADDLKKTLKKIDEQLTQYENGIYKLYKPNYLHDDSKLKAIKNQDIPIDDKVHTLLKTLKTARRGVPAADISDISI